ncbi:hypothetical protein NW759_016841 [Fusarium solani]|nr:hypothetical protein NW759_016841 [Fusarium solani]
MTGFGLWLGDPEQRVPRTPLLQLSSPVSRVQHNRTISASQKRMRASPNPPAKSSDEYQAIPNTEPDIQDTIICASTDPVSKVDDQPEDIPHRRSVLAKRSVAFDQIFQNGKAPVKHVIIQYPLNYGPWFILRCDEHDINFRNQLGAAAHLRSNKHGHPRHVSTSMVIEHFSIESKRRQKSSLEDEALNLSGGLCTEEEIEALC